MQIDAKTQKLEEFLFGLNTQFKVPSYQRDYSWTPDNMDELWSDLTAALNRDVDYFMGTTVLNSEAVGDTGAYDIVDGQQRLATFTVLFAVLRDRCAHFLANTDHPVYSRVDLLNPDNKRQAERARRLAEDRILHVSEPDHYYLELNSKDQSAFFSQIQKPGDALNGDSDWKLAKSDARLIKAKKLLSKKVVNEFLKHADGFVRIRKFVAHLITRILFLRIEVKSDIDAYLLFESLNDRGLDLSISDLVKNRMLMVCGSDSAKKKRVLEKWDSMVEHLNESRYPQPQEFLRFYWIAFHGNTTKKELYGHIKTHLSNHSTDIEDFVDRLLESAEILAELTDASLKYPSGSYTANSTEQWFAELNTLGYSVCYPLLLRAKRDRPGLIPILAPVLLNFLFRLVSIGGFAANIAEDAVSQSMAALKSGEPDRDVLSHLTHPELSDALLVERIRIGKFEDNQLARYLLSKIHDADLTPAVRLTKEAHLEHVLPIEPNLWTFDAKSRHITDWIYSIGNMTLLEEGVNKGLRNKPFKEKVLSYDEKTAGGGHTSIPMTHAIHKEHIAGRLKWDAKWISERTDYFAAKAVHVWPLPVIPPPTIVSPGLI